MNRRIANKIRGKFARKYHIPTEWLDNKRVRHGIKRLWRYLERQLDQMMDDAYNPICR